MIISSQRNTTNSQGFTLIEVVLAFSILAVIITVAYAMLRSTIEAKDTLDDLRDGMFIANSLLIRMSRELQLADTDALLPTCDKSSSNTKPSASSLNLIGETEQIDSNSADKITFLAREAGQYIPDGGTHTGVVQITYRVEKDPEKKDSKDAGLLLVRDEMPYRQPATRACADAIRFPITNNLVSLKFSYYDKRTDTWVDTWGTPPYVRLPKMIQFTLQLRSPEGTIQTFTSAVAVRAET